MPGCVSRILVVSVFGGCGLWFGGCKRHCRIMMYVASSTRSQLANNSPVRGWKNWEDKNLVVIYTVTTTRSHDKKKWELFCAKMKKVRGWEIGGGKLLWAIFSSVKILDTVSYVRWISKQNLFKVGCNASLFLFQRAQHPTTNNTHKNTNKTTSATINNGQS